MEKSVLTKRQHDIYIYIKDFINTHKYSPTIRELCKALNMSSTASVYDQLKKLENKGYIKRNNNKFRSIELIEDNTLITIPYIKSSELHNINNSNTITISNYFNLDNNSIFIDDNNKSYIIKKCDNYQINDSVLIEDNNYLYIVKYKEDLNNVLGKILYKIEKK